MTSGTPTDGGMVSDPGLTMAKSGQHPGTNDQENKPRGPHEAWIILWLILVGWWLSLLLNIAAWLLILSGIGARVGMRLLSHAPRVTFLEQADESFVQHTSGTAEAIRSADAETSKHPGLRLAYAAVIGWWISALTIIAAWLLTLSVFGIPVARRLYVRAPRLATLAVYP